MTHESDLSNREATLAVEQKDQDETRVRILSCELTANIRGMRLNSREEELEDREKWLAKRQLQELATSHGRLEEF
jgi:hypothetical protein